MQFAHQFNALEEVTRQLIATARRELTTRGYESDDYGTGHVGAVLVPNVNSNAVRSLRFWVKNDFVFFALVDALVYLHDNFTTSFDYDYDKDTCTITSRDDFGNKVETVFEYDDEAQWTIKHAAKVRETQEAAK